jgi:hypothetical protein
MSTYEGEHMIFGLLGQANLTQNDVLQFHPFTSKCTNSQRKESTFALISCDPVERVRFLNHLVLIPWRKELTGKVSK